MGAPAPQGGEKSLGVIYSENLQVHQDTKCTPSQAEQKSILRTFFAGRIRFGGLFSSLGRLF